MWYVEFSQDTTSLLYNCSLKMRNSAAVIFSPGGVSILKRNVAWRREIFGRAPRTGIQEKSTYVQDWKRWQKFARKSR